MKAMKYYERYIAKESNAKWLEKQRREREIVEKMTEDEYAHYLAEKRRRRKKAEEIMSLASLMSSLVEAK